MQKLREYLAGKAKGITFVHGSRKRKSAEQKEYEQLQRVLPGAVGKSTKDS